MAHERAQRRGRARRHRQHRLGRRLRRADRPGRLLRLEGRHRRHDAADRARPGRARHPRLHDRARALRHAAAGRRCRRRRASRSASRCPSRRASASPPSTRRSPPTSSRTPMLNGETIRLDGAHPHAAALSHGPPRGRPTRRRRRPPPAERGAVHPTIFFDRRSSCTSSRAGSHRGRGRPLLVAGFWSSAARSTGCAAHRSRCVARLWASASRLHRGYGASGRHTAPARQRLSSRRGARPFPGLPRTADCAGEASARTVALR